MFTKRALIKFYTIPAAMFGSFITGTNFYNSHRLNSYLYRYDSGLRSTNYSSYIVMTDFFSLFFSTFKGTIYGIVWPVSMPVTLYAYFYEDAKCHTYLLYSFYESDRRIYHDIDRSPRHTAMVPLSSAPHL